MGMGTMRVMVLLLGTAAYQRLLRPDWRQPALLLYDIPTLALAFSFTGKGLGDLVAGRRSRGCVELAALLAATTLAWGAAYRSWPLSGHLTVGLTAGIMEAGDPLERPWIRRVALLPPLIVASIRTLWPQSALMGNRTNTLTALALGLLLGLAGLLSARKTLPAAQPVPHAAAAVK